MKAELNSSTQTFVAVQAYTEAGPGDLSRKVLAQNRLNPVPKVLLTTDKLEILDIDKNFFQDIPVGYLNVVTATFSSYDHSVYWFNEGNELLVFNIETECKSKRVSFR